jgi:hypothetical protein
LSRDPEYCIWGCRAAHASNKRRIIRASCVHINCTSIQVQIFPPIPSTAKRFLLLRFAIHVSSGLCPVLPFHNCLSCWSVMASKLRRSCPYKCWRPTAFSSPGPVLPNYTHPGPLSKFYLTCSLELPTFLFNLHTLPPTKTKVYFVHLGRRSMHSLPSASSSCYVNLPKYGIQAVLHTYMLYISLSITLCTEAISLTAMF